MTSPAVTHPSALVRLADFSYRRRRLMILGWLGLLVVMSVLGNRYAGDHSFTFAVPGAESQRAQDLLEVKFPARSGDTLDVVFEADRGVRDPAVQARVEELLRKVDGVDHVEGIVSPYAPEGARQIAPDGRIAFASARLDLSYEDEFPRDDGRALIALAEEASGDGLDVQLSGFAIQYAEEAEFGSEAVGLVAAVFILLVSFGSVLAMGLPIVTAIVGLGIGTALIGLMANLLEVPDFAPQVAAMIGIGVGIDYVLFIVTRYRSSLHAGLEPRQAVITAITTSGRAVLFAGCTVIISLLGLFIMNLGFLRGLAVAAISVVLIVMLASVTFVPALLGFIGHTIDRLHVPLFAKKLAGDRDSMSYRWSRIVQRRPLPAAIVCAAALIAMAVPLFDLRFGFPDAGTNPEHYTSRKGYDLMAKGFGAGVNGPLLLVARGDGAVAERLAPVQQQVAATDGVMFVSPPVPSPDGDVALLLAVPEQGPASEATQDLVHRLRRDVLPAASRGTGTDVAVGGSTAASIDASDYIEDRLLVFIGAVIVLSFLLLLVVFRSVLVPIKAAIMNVLSIAAAYGVLSIASQGGWFGNLIGIEEAIPVPSFLPMMMFAILFGLSMDYEVFLLSRVREEYVKTGDNASAVADGLASTARVITAAAAIMVSVFLAFVLGEQVIPKLIGIGLATAILVDATLVRMVLVPATMELLGDANWWLPRWLDRVLPEVHVEGESAEELEAELAQLVKAEKDASTAR
jgi:RND superfamily putative drug exporter